MASPEQMMNEIRSSVQTALERAEAFMARVHLQVNQLPPMTSLKREEITAEEGWEALRDRADGIAENIDQELNVVRQGLAEFLKAGQELQASLTRK